ncbi:MAG: Fic family protein [Christensenellaceae bacterium]|jgi:Fic family protein|nr:Fic family protein [Christensenellaceae bacterium]
MSEFLYKPKYTLTDEIVTLVADIAAKVEALTIHSGMEQNPKLRRINRVKSIHSSLAIENNTLTVEQVTALLDGKRVLAPPQDILEAQNAIQAYNKLLDYNPYDVDDLLSAHGVLMKGLVSEAGQFRSGFVGVARGNEIIHIAPPAIDVSGLIADLFRWVEGAKVHPLIKSCVFHYEFEFIHPFQDGNGRMGRMWQTLLLSQWKQIFAWLPVESIVRDRQQEYYAALSHSNDAMVSTEFITFMLNALNTTIDGYTDQDSDQVTDQVKRLIDVLGTSALSASELMSLLELKHRPTFRQNYLHPALEAGLIEMTLPDSPNSRNQRYRRKGS